MSKFNFRFTITVMFIISSYHHLSCLLINPSAQQREQADIQYLQQVEGMQLMSSSLERVMLQSSSVVLVR